LLRAYEDHLPPAELALLCRLCLLRRSVTEEQILQLFLCAPAVHARTVRELADAVTHLPDAESYPAGLLQELAEDRQETVQEALCAPPIAGREEVFRQAVRPPAQGVSELPRQSIAADVAELARLYADTHLDAPTDQRPLPAQDRARLRELCARYLEL